MTTTPDSRIRADWTMPAETAAPPPGVPTRAQAGHLVDQMTPELRAEMEAYWARAEPYDTTDRHLGPMTHRPAAEPNFIFAREDFMQKLASATSAPIDTSTTAGKVAVMQHAETHGASSIECRKKSSFNPDRYSRLTCDTPDILWNWEFFDYRIAPPPAARTALQRARDLRSRLDLVDSMAADGILYCLLTDIDYSPVVEVLERRISWDAADLSALPKGRYRLLRDDQ